MTDLAARLREVIDERLRVAREAAKRCGCHDATPVWTFQGDTEDEATNGRILIEGDAHADVRRMLGKRWNRSYNDMFDARHIALNDPEDAILAGEHALWVLVRHRPQPDEPTLCSVCFHGGLDYGDYGFPDSWPCDDIRILAKRYGIEVE